MISRTTEYALRAFVWLAARPETPQTTRTIAAGTSVPAGYLAKVMQQLVEAGLVTSQRGLGGGFLLVRPPEKVSVLDVVNAVEPIERIRSCPLQLDAHRTQLCALHRKLDDALALIEGAFAGTKVAELVDQSGRIQPLCPRPKSQTPRFGNLARPGRSPRKR